LRGFVPGFADWCAADYFLADGELETVHSGYPDVLQEALILEIRRRYRAEHGESGEVLSALRHGETVMHSDMSHAAGLEQVSGAFDPAQRALLDTLSLRSSIVVPLHHEGQALGIVSFISKTRRFDEEDRARAVQLAAEVREILLRRREQAQSGESLLLLEKLYRAAPIGLGLVDTELRYRRVNEHLAAINGLPAEAHIGRSVVEVLGDLGQELAPLLRAVIDTREPISREMAGETAAQPGVRRHWQATYSPVELEGRLLGVSLVVEDITPRRRREARSQFLARAVELLDSSLDYMHTLRSVAGLAVPEIADWCSISMINERGRMYRLAVAHSDPAKHALAQELLELESLPLDAPAGAAAAMREARPLFVEDYGEQMLEASLRNPRSKQIVQELGIRCAISVPLIARGRMLGAISLVGERPGRLTHEDVQLAEELATRVSIQIDNARLFTQLSGVAHTLQAGLMPRALPSIPRVELAARYRPAGEINEVGGDFYDVYLRGPQEWLIVMGDVTGKGADAAAATALVRYTLRAAAQHPGSPSELLGELNSSMLEQQSSHCTAAIISLNVPAEGPVTGLVSLAGHPPPLLRRGDGESSSIGRTGLLLGWSPEPRHTDVPFTLQAGDTLLLYTDGLTDSAAPHTWSELHLRSMLRSAPVRDLGLLLATLEGAAVIDAEGRPRDDIALLALRMRP
jgi:PAS domain S-box-containing protein